MGFETRLPPATSPTTLDNIPTVKEQADEIGKDIIKSPGISPLKGNLSPASPDPFNNELDGILRSAPKPTLPPFTREEYKRIQESLFPKKNK